MLLIALTTYQIDNRSRQSLGTPHRDYAGPDGRQGGQVEGGAGDAQQLAEGGVSGQS